MIKKIDLLIKKAILSSNNFDSMEYLRLAKNIIYKQADLNNNQKLIYLEKIERVANKRHIPS